MFNVKGKPESLTQEILAGKNALVRGFGKVLCKSSGNKVPSALACESQRRLEPVTHGSALGHSPSALHPKNRQVLSISVGGYVMRLLAI